MANLSDWLENKLNDHYLGNTPYTPPSNVYLGLYTSAPNDAGGGTEVPAGGNYAPLTIANNLTNWGNAGNRLKRNQNELAFAVASAAWGLISHWVLRDAASGGNLLFWGRFEDDNGNPAPRQVNTNNQLFIAALGLKFQVTGARSTFLSNKLLDLVLGGVAYTAPLNIFWAQYTVAPSENGGGTEVNTGGYARVQQANNTTNFPNSSGGVKQNGAAVTFPAATANQGTITHWGLHDAATNGNSLVSSPYGAPQTINTGDQASYPVGAFTFTEN